MSKFGGLVGIDWHGALSLKYFIQKNNLGKTLTIGRQGIHIPPKLLKQLFDLDKSTLNEIYDSDIKVNDSYFCENLLKFLGATSVDSIDASEYEGANIIFNLNNEYDKKNDYETLIDFGSSEHIYNVAQVFKNYSQLVKDGGNLIHYLPSNNQCGHGFYQFSPEFFYSLYSTENGYRDTEIFMVEIPNHKQWFKISSPPKGERIVFDSKQPCYVICFTKKFTSNIGEINVQQSYYDYEWNKQEIEDTRNLNKLNVKLIIKKIPILFKLTKIIIHYPRFWFILIKTRLKLKQEKNRRAFSLKDIKNRSHSKI
jgi:hypothetical protein